MRRDSPVDEAEIRRYLLGELPEQASAPLEQAYFADPDLLARIELVEADLVDDYVAERLTAEERDKFERNYLATPEHRDEVALARTLRQAAATGASRSASAPAGSARRAPGAGIAWSSWWRWAAAAAMVVVVVAVAWRVRNSPMPPAGVDDTRLPADVQRSPSAQVEAPPGSTPPTPAPVPPKAVTVALRLSRDVVRGEGRPATLAIPATATDVELQFHSDRQPVERQRARLAAVDGGVVWTGKVLRGRPAGPDASAARVVVPAKVLPPGDYVLSVSMPERPSAEGPQQFYFRILPR